MVRELLKYPDPKIRLISGNVRSFDATLHANISDMIDTMKVNDLDALSAIQIGIQQHIVVLRQGETYTPYINVRFIKQKGSVTTTERTPYYENMSVDVDRYESLTVLYEDEQGAPHSMDVTGELARIFQHQVDYCDGSTFVDRVDKEIKQQIGDYLEFGLVEGASTCPTIFYRDYFKRAAGYVLLAVLVNFFTPLFVGEATKEIIYTIDKYLLGSVPLILVGYFFYARYETEKYKQCTSCQTGNIIGTSAIITLQWLIVLAGTYLIFS